MAKTKRKTLPKNFEELLAAGDLEALKSVFDTCDVDARGGVFKQTAPAFADCPDDLVRWLVERGADLSAPDSYGRTPLHSRAGHWQGNVDLLIALGADVNHDAGGATTPLHEAAGTGNLRAAQSLLRHGARPDARNRDGQTPLDHALRRCSNVLIERLVPMAELLLAAMSSAPARPAPFFSRLLRRSSGPASPITPEMQDMVRRIGTDFEFHRAGYNADSVNAVSDALDRLCALFGVPPVPRRIVHDGRSPIVVEAATWQDQHNELWQMLVPSSGAAPTVQGEVIRISGRVDIELSENGGANWDGDYRQMVAAFLRHLEMGRPLPAAELDAARRAAQDARASRCGSEEMCRLAVQWVILNPDPIPLEPPPYQR